VKLPLGVTEEHRLKVSEDRVMRRLLGSERVEGTGERRQIHNKAAS